MKNNDQSKADGAASHQLTPLQIKAIQEFDALINPAAMASFSQNASREQWRKAAEFIDALKELLPKTKTETEAV